MSNVQGHIHNTIDTKSEAQMLFRNVCFLLNWERTTNYLTTELTHKIVL